jgi:serine/threonine protein kinase
MTQRKMKQQQQQRAFATDRQTQTEDISSAERRGAKRRRTEESIGDADEQLLPLFADFIAAMLRYLPDERATPRQLLRHPFLRSKGFK